MFSSNDKLYEAPANHVAVKKYAPRFLARGYEHIVYKMGTHPSMVIKVSAHKIVDVVAKYWGQGTELPTDEELAMSVHNDYHAEIQKKNHEAYQLRIYFGKDHTLPERRYLSKVPISTALLSVLFENDYRGRALPLQAENLRESWTHVVVQKFCAEAFDPDRLSFSFGSFCEERNVTPHIYERVTRFLLGDETIKVSRDEFLYVQDGDPASSLSRVIIRAELDGTLRAAVADFLSRSAHFAIETGQILGLAGADNVFFYQKAKSWSYWLIDAIPIPVESIYSRTLRYAAKLRSGHALSPREKGIIRRGLNFVRVINGSAVYLGLARPISSPEELRQLDVRAVLE